MDKPDLFDIVILGGGRGSRFGGCDKGLLLLAGKPLIEHTIDRLRPTNNSLIISANRNLAFYQRYTSLVVSDSYGEYCGPLAGILAAQSHLRHEHTLIAPCDMPFLPVDIVHRLRPVLQASKQQICCVAHNQGIEPLVCMISNEVIGSLVTYLDSGQRSVLGWLKRQGFVTADYATQSKEFVNINSATQLAEAEKVLDRHPPRSADSKDLFLAPGFQQK